MLDYPVNALVMEREVKFFLRFFVLYHGIRALTDKADKLLEVCAEIEFFGCRCRLFPVGRNIFQLVIKAGADVCPEGALNAVQLRGKPEFESAHIPQVRKIVFAAGSGTRHAGKAHCKADPHKSLENGFYCRTLAPYKTEGVVGALFKGASDKLRYLLAVVFAVYKRGNAPLGNAYVFCKHIAHAGSEHSRRGVFQNIGVAYNYVGAF